MTWSRYSALAWLVLRASLYATAYHLFAVFIGKPAFPPLQVLLRRDLWPALQDIQPHLVATLTNWAVYFCWAVAAATGLGLLLGSSSRAWRNFSMELEFFRSIPATCLVVFLLAAFGDHDVCRNFPAIYISFFTVLFYVAVHAQKLHTGKIEHLRMLQMPWLMRVRSCVLPETTGAALISMRHTISLSFLVLVSVEIMIGNSNGTGLGEVFYLWSFGAKFGRILWGIFVLGTVGLLLNVVARLMSRVALRWIGIAEGKGA